MNTIFGNSDDEKLAHFSSDEENFSDLSDVDEGVVPRAKTGIKKWVVFTKRSMKSAKKTGARRGSRRGGGVDGSDDEVNLGDILPEGTKRKKRAVADDEDDGAVPVPGERVKKAANKMSDEEIKAKCVAFVERMDQASFEDNESNRNKKPALKKLTMLEETKQMLLRQDWHEHLLNAGVLVVATKWLSPLPDRTLPNVTIRDSLIRCLSSFQEITKYMLKESKVAAVVMFLSRNDPEPSIRKSAAELVQQWSRTLSSGPDSWQSLSEVERHRTPGGAGGAGGGGGNGAGASGEGRLSQNAQRILSAQMAYGRKIQGAEPSKKVQGPQFASQPLVSTMDYTVRPESKVDVTTLVKKSAAPRIFAKLQ